MYQYERVTEKMEAFLVEQLEDNCHLAIREMVDALLYGLGVQVSKQTVKRAVDDVGYTVKKLHQHSSLMNMPVNRKKRFQRGDAARTSVARYVCIVMNIRGTDQ